MMIFGLFLILAGVLFLLRNTGLLPDQAWYVVWPLILIVLGGGAFFHGRETKGGFCWPGCACMWEGTKGGSRKKRAA